MLENGKFFIETGENQIEARVVSFCDLEAHHEFRFVTNLPVSE